MSSLAIAAVASFSFLAAGANDIASHKYADAYKQAQDDGKTMVVLIGASWCPACQTMKTSVLPTVANRGGLKRVAFAYVNTDEQGPLAGKLMSGNLIPQLVKYEKTGESWKVTRLVGGQSVSAVEQFVGSDQKQPVASKDRSFATTAAQN